ncbi:MAG: LON peptidase substrate-binding domain-containing protein [Chromatiales bacterium]
MHSRFKTDFDALPKTLPLFPLPGVTLLPDARLPLNVFEPRYLSMFDDALGSHRLIGIIQPNEGNDGLAPVGCAGRIQVYSETSDGRLEVVLTGLCRFRLTSVSETPRGYLITEPDWQPFARDYTDDLQISSEREQLLHQQIRDYANDKQLRIDHEYIESLTPLELVNSLVTNLPLSGKDKQTLLEIPSAEDRLDWLQASMSVSSLSGSLYKH